MTDGPRILTIDIETAPIIADRWTLWDDHTGLDQVHEYTRVICFAAKWHDERKVQFYSEYHHGFVTMIEKAWELIDAADIVVGWNSKRFDVPHLKREFKLRKMAPPSPFKQVDLMQAVKAEFKFASNKLDHISQQLGFAGKVKHEGHTLWAKCLRPDMDAQTRQRAWTAMARYNKRDVVITEQCYDDLLAWIPGHPNVALYSEHVEDEQCRKCGSDDLRREGYAYTADSKFQRYQCRNCNTWGRFNKRLALTTTRGGCVTDLVKLVEQAATQTAKWHAEFVQYDDLFGELAVYAYENRGRFQQWIDNDEAHRVVLALKGRARIYGETEKAAKLGYEYDDVAWYSPTSLASLIPIALDPQWDGLTGEPEDPSVSSSTPANEGGNLLAMVCDVRRVFELHFVPPGGFDPDDEVGKENLDIVADWLGGDYPDAPGYRRGRRKSLSNSAAIALLKEQA